MKSIKIYIDKKLGFHPNLPEHVEITNDPEKAELLFTIDGTITGHGYIVTCCEPDVVMSMEKEKLAAFYDIWLLPVIGPLWQVKLEKLLVHITDLLMVNLEKSWLETLIDSMPDMVWFKSLDGLHMKVNQAFCKAAGKTRKMIEGRDHYFIWNVNQNSADYDEICVNSDAEAVLAGKTCTFNEVLRIGNQKRHLQTYKTPIYDRRGKVVGTVGIAHDITNILNLNREVDIFLEAMPFPIIMHNEKGIITHLNQKFVNFFHEKKDDIIGTAYADWKAWSFTYKADSTSFMDNGEERFLSVLETELKDIFGSVFGGLVVFSDITAEKKLEIQIRKSASEDRLTGLANRSAMNEYFQKMDKGVFHLLYLDLDNFKKVNDCWGHETGDIALKKTAAVMRETCPDDFLVRLGGDEFLICIAKEMQDKELVALANKLQTNLSNCFSSMDKLSGISLSIGIRPACDPKLPLAQLIHEADQAMYTAKQNGKAQAKIWKP